MKYLSFLVVLVMGCTNTVLNNPKLSNPSAIQRLEALAGRKIEIRIADSVETETLGHQYLFFVLPWGRIQANPYDFLVPQLRTEMALKGLALSIQEAASLELTIRDTQVSAYDWFFVRHNVVSFTSCFKAKTADQSSIIWCTETAADSWNAYGFATELSALFTQVAKKSAQKLVDFLSKIAPK